MRDADRRGPVVTDEAGSCAPSTGSTTRSEPCACWRAPTPAFPSASAIRAPAITRSLSDYFAGDCTPWPTLHGGPRHAVPAQGLGGAARTSRPARPAATGSGRRDRRAQRGARRGPGQRPEPDRPRRALPSGDRRRRLAHRLRRRPRAQALAAAPRRRGVQGRSDRRKRSPSRRSNQTGSGHGIAHAAWPRTAAWPGGRRGRRGRGVRRGVPSSTTRPASITTMRSAASTVARRWAMTRVVRPCMASCEGALDQPLVLGVQGAGGLVEQQDRRVADQRAGDGEALALAAGEGLGALARAGCRSPAAGRRGSPRPGRRVAAARSSLRRGVLAAEAQVVAAPSRRTAARPGPPAPCGRAPRPGRRRAGRRRRGAPRRPAGRRSAAAGGSTVLLPAPEGPTSATRSPGRDASGSKPFSAGRSGRPG